MRRAIIPLAVIFVLFSALTAMADYGTLEVITFPAEECYVYLDNIAVGSTPLKLNNITIGNHWLEVIHGNKSVYLDEVQVNYKKASLIKITIPTEIIETPIDLSAFITRESVYKKVQSFEAASEEECVVSAEPRIKKLAEKERNGRKYSSDILIGVGGITTLLGLYSGGKYGSDLVICGISFAGLGLLSGSLKSELEYDYERILNINDQTKEGQAERVRSAEEALSKKAEKEKNSRHYDMGMMGGYGLLLTATGAGAIIGIPAMIFAWSQYDAKSEYENEYDEYLKEKEEKQGGATKHL